MKTRNQLIEHHAKEAAEEIREAEVNPCDKRTPRLIIESSMFRLAGDLESLDFERGSNLLRSLQGRMVGGKK